MKNKIKELGDRADRIKEQLKTEEATKQSLVLPFIQMLGYDIYDPTEVVPEYIADVPGKKGEKIDYVIKKDNSPVILIECKSWTEGLPKHTGQLFRYYSTIPGPKLAILTNGLKYLLFSDLEETNKLDEIPFFEFDIREVKEPDVSEIAKLQKANLDIDHILNTASEMKYAKSIKDLLNELLINPSEDFIKFLVKNIYEGVLSSNRFSFFEPIVKGSVKQVIDDIFTDRLNKVLEANAQKAKESLAKETLENEVNKESKIITTQEELDFFSIVRGILGDSLSIERILYKDYQTYFGIMIDGKLSKTFCKFVSNNKKKSMTLIKSDKTEEEIEIQKIEETYKYKEKFHETLKTYLSE